MNGLSLLAIVLAIASSVFTWMDFSSKQLDDDVTVHALLNAAGQEEISPDEVHSLQVARWNAEKKAAEVFAVAYVDGSWAIPSHHNYPADGGKRVGETAGSVLNIPRGPLVTQDPQSHAELGVLDPLEMSELEDGYGQHITLEGAGGKALVNLIIGKRSETANVVYVREAGRDQVYTADISLNVTTAFKDWVETGLLELEFAAVRSVHIQDYSVNEQSGQIEQRAETAFDRINTAEPWISSAVPEGKVVSKDKVDALVNEAAAVQLVGVRPYADDWLEQRGFYLGKKGEIYGNEGALVLVKQNGVVYYLFFGEIALGDESDTNAQVEAKAEAGDNRYMVVFTRYDEKADQLLLDLEAEQKKAQALKAEKAANPEAVVDPAAPAADQPIIAAEPERDFAKEIAERKASGMEEAAEKQKRFGKFFYVIADSSFLKLRPSQTELFIDPPAQTEAAPAPQQAAE